ncbi:MAG: ABC transporter ATP-binding protein [Oscillospiraceae bacterium]|nr:ABC transporter ATP-binding protein [Oscillospiraceae bacterium]
MKLEIKNLSAGYDTGAVLKNLSIHVAEGEFLSLLGPSGCGKTTLMKTIAGILPAQSGTVSLDGRDITNLPIHKRSTVIVFQDMRLFPHQSVAENVAFPLKMLGVSKSERLKKAEELLEKVQMAGFGSRKPSELSGGQQQRIALARALAAEPKLLLLDEPFSALDENLREDMRNLVLQLRQEFQMTVILVTHDREEALSMSDRVALMFEGQIAQIGTPMEVYHTPACRRVADYFGDCVYWPGHVCNGQFIGSGISCPVQVPDGDYEMMLRPDSLNLDDSGSYRLSVDNVSFRGSDTLVTFRAEDGTRWKKSFPHAVHWKAGDTASAIIRPSSVLFPDAR